MADTIKWFEQDSGSVDVFDDQSQTIETARIQKCTKRDNGVEYCVWVEVDNKYKPEGGGGSIKIPF